MSDLNLNLNLNPPSYCFAGPKGDSLYHWVATLIGPSGTPYEDGIFFLDITFPSEYPFKPPEVQDCWWCSKLVSTTAMLILLATLV
ncbi:constitutive photomorphogenesis protein 10-like isoform X6 [Camellia sinensis]|uniref:constitutive photomorphogenesis protein 10-like isoform X6 n=1 Tax=Camellia sinensis TaxID=4442 RepID=UPI001035C78B|nr:constitutive photomorphogenesis protein 10-like isoform X6 [Camellia sinensis]